MTQKQKIHLRLKSKPTSDSKPKTENFLSGKQEVIIKKKQEKYSIYEKISRSAIYALVFLLPVFFLPWTNNVLDFNKQTLLIILVIAGFLCWMGNILSQGRIKIRLSFLYIPIIIFLVSYGISTIFSHSRYGSFWGLPLSVSESFLTLAGFVMFLFLIVNLFQKKKDILLLLVLSVFSGFLAVIFGIFQLFEKFFIPFNFAQTNSFNTVGAVNGLAVFSAVLLPLTICFILIFKKWKKLFFIIIGLVFLFFLLIVNYWVAWTILAIGTGLILCFCFIAKKLFNTRKMMLPMLIFSISILFIFLKISLPGLPDTPLEVSVNYSTGFDIASESLRHNFLFGTGPGTFIFNYSKFKPIELNQTIFWNTRFTNGSSKIFDGIGTYGGFGIFALLGIFASFIYFAFEKLRIGLRELKTIDFDWILSLGIFGAWLSSGIGLFICSGSICLEYLFWLTMAAFLALNINKIKEKILKPSSRLMIFLSFLLLFSVILGMGVVLLQSQRYIAEIKYFQGLKELEKGEIDSALQDILKATSFNNKQDNYWRDLSQVYLNKINQEIQNKTDISQDEISTNIGPIIAQAINSSKTATDLEPHNVTNWVVRGYIYYNCIGMIDGAAEWAITSYEKAAELEPLNPYIYTQLGKVKLSQGNILKKQEKNQESSLLIIEANKDFQKAIELKTDYAPAHYQTAIAYQLQGKTQNMVKKLEETKIIAPFDPGLAFQLGILYYGAKDFDKAKTELARAVSLKPNYSNARYFLGLIYDKQGDKSKAIQEFEKIIAFNPGNNEVKKILENLRSGKPALENADSAAAAESVPIEDKLDEIK